MRMFLLNSLLALAWAAVGGELSLPSLLVGFSVGFVALYVACRALGDATYHSQLVRICVFVLTYMLEMFRSGLRVAHDVLTPTSHMRPGIVTHKLRAVTDAEITALANLISLTPGTLALDVTTDRKFLYVHTMFVEGETEQIATLEARLLAILRGHR